MELDVNALQVLPEAEPEVGLWPCAPTCTTLTTPCTPAQTK
ncbi:ALQxL family class IV lanthipeptide [Micromonosporaceae bacterium B7E4]